MAPLNCHRGVEKEAPCELEKNGHCLFGVEFSVGICQSWMVYGAEVFWFLMDPSTSEVFNYCWSVHFSLQFCVSFMQVEVLLSSEIMFIIHVSFR